MPALGYFSTKYLTCNYSRIRTQPLSMRLHLMRNKFSRKRGIQLFCCSLLVGTLFLSCSKDGEDIQFCNATVRNKSLDCGTFLLEFDKEPNIFAESYGTIFYEMNLPDEFKIPEKKIVVEIRKLNDDELFACTTQGPSYGMVYTLSARER